LRRQPDPRFEEDREMRQAAAEIDRLELAARLGSAQAEVLLEQIADNRVGRERARLAGQALRSVKSRKN
jgi:hypothetical protein